MKNKIRAKKILVALLAILVLLSGTYIGYRIVSEQQRRKKIIAAFSAEEGYDGALNERYIAYYDQYYDVAVSELLELVNNGIDQLDVNYDRRLIRFIKAEGFDSKDIARYLEYSDKTQADEETVVGLVSHDIDKSGLEYNGRLKDILEDPYFIWDRVERYCAYDSSHQDENLKTRELVERINCNLDMIPKGGDLHADPEKGVLILVNNYYDLIEDFVPDDLVDVDKAYSSKGARMDAEAYSHFVQMAEAARAAGYKVTINGDNGYRSYSYQSTVFEYYCKMLGREAGEKRAAQPGYSEHQTGLAADIAVDKAKGFNWLAENCYKYGFIVRYPDDKTDITGYVYERWHFRYVGTDVAEYIHKTGITFDEYYACFVEP
ncbi:MAG: M15 family metallopeptidase [Erysipelotrichaceae bacterium]|nr:M15 family metallopeptidase [Erysipelotrichaceae bacterium]MBR5049054.1 M15 family metallopeptidase [Erysipelotrichaceae bacterium]